jgi:hypothetical protein
MENCEQTSYVDKKNLHTKKGLQNGTGLKIFEIKEKKI